MTDQVIELRRYRLRLVPTERSRLQR